MVVSVDVVVNGDVNGDVNGVTRDHSRRRRARNGDANERKPRRPVVVVAASPCGDDDHAKPQLRKNPTTVSTTCRTPASPSSGYTGNASTSFAARSDTGKSPSR